MFTKAVLFIIPFLVVGTVMHADTMVLDRQKCLELALENSPTLLKSDISLKTAAAKKNGAWNLFVPSLSASVGLSEKGPLSGPQDTGYPTLNTSLSLSYRLLPSLPYQIRQLSLSLKSSELSYEAARQQVLAMVETRFYSLLIVKSNLAIMENNISLAGKRYDQAELRYQNGLASELEVLQLKVSHANLIPAYTSARTAYNNSLREFLSILGIDPLSNVKLEGEITVEPAEYDSQTLITRYLENRSDINLQRTQIEILQNALKIYKAGKIVPVLSLSAGWGDTVTDAFDSASWSGRTANKSLTFSAGLTFNLTDLLPGSGASLNVRETQDSLESAGITLDSALQQATIEIINLCDALDTAKERLDLSMLNLELSQKSYQMTEDSYNQGNSDQLTVDDAQQDLLTAQQNLLESQSQYIISLISLKAALGLDAFGKINSNAITGGTENNEGKK